MTDRDPRDTQPWGRPRPPDDKGLPEIPGFRVERLLGQGGMGRVFLARQLEPVERTVAIKLLRAAVVDRETAYRFEMERRTLARLSHPAIAQLYTAGTPDDGPPYVVMEHVDGVRITEHCDREKLSTEERLRLFVAVCRGVEHAHRKQVLHRDLKPSNILVTEVDGAAVPKIIDFGIARILEPRPDDAQRTGSLVLGTPHYLSPEALEWTDGPRDLDTRTDVYSLGVVLYELLTGTRPYDEETGATSRLIRRILEEEPERPSSRVKRLEGRERRLVDAARPEDPDTLARKLAGDLDWIVLTALARDREARYGSPAALADDLERHLAHRPVSARPPSLRDRLGKLVRRHRLAAALAAVTLTAVLVSALLVSLALVRATRAEERAVAEAAATAEVAGFLVDLFEAARPEDDLGRDVTARELVERGAERIEERELPPLQRARLLSTLAEVQMRLGAYEPGRRLAAEALAIREQHLGDDQPDLWESLDLLGNLSRRAGRLDDASRALERHVELVEQHGGDRRLADALNSLSNLRWRQQRLEEAEELQARALGLRRALAEAGEPGGEELAASLNNLGVMLWSQGRHADAEPYLRESVAAWEESLSPNHPRVADALGNLGIVLYQLGRLEEDEALQRRALAIREEVLGPDHPDTSAALNNLGIVLRRLDRPEEAEVAYRRALEIRRQALGPEHPETVKTSRNLARLLEEEGRAAEAEELRRRAGVVE